MTTCYNEKQTPYHYSFTAAFNYRFSLSFADVFVDGGDVCLVGASGLKTGFLFAADTKVLSAAYILSKKVIPSAYVFGGVCQMLHSKGHAPKEFTTVNIDKTFKILIANMYILDICLLQSSMRGSVVLEILKHGAEVGNIILRE